MARTAYILLTFTALFWGGNAVAGKLAVGHISPVMLTSLRWLVAFLVMLAIGHRNFRNDLPVLRANALKLFLYGAGGFAGFNIILYSGLQYTTAINATIVQAGMPMLVILANFALFAIRVSPLQIVGFFLTLAGIGLTAGHGDIARVFQLDLNRGDAILLIAVLLYAAYTVALRFKPQVHWQSFMIALTFSAFLATVPFLGWEVASGTAHLPDMLGLAAGAYTAIFPSILSQVFYIRGNEILGANRAGLFINVVPIFGTGLSILILGEAFQPFHAAALLFVFSGIAISEMGGRRLAARTG